ncbi:MAG: HAD family hydrolase [Pseudomonadota bacterium]
MFLEKDHTLVVCFDLDDTLMDHASAIIGGARQFYADHRHVFDLPESDFVARWVQRIEAAYQRYLHEGLSLEDARRWRVQSLFAEAGAALSDAAADTAVAQAIAAYRDHWRLFDDVRPCLEALQGRFPLAVITNGSADQQSQKLLQLGIRSVFEAVIVSETAGSAKPAPDIFRHAARQLGTTPARCLHVGDRWDIDVTGARSAGFRAVWLNRSGQPRTPAASDVAELTSLTTLPQLVEAQA